jgi:hypothetical protein
MPTESTDLSPHSPAVTPATTEVAPVADDRDIDRAVRAARVALGLDPKPPPALPLARVKQAPAPRVVLSYGLGVDSTAILVRWLLDPSSRDFDLRDLAVITAMTGQEWPTTGHLVEEKLLPLLAANRIRYLQIARRGPAQADGIDILADSRAADRLHLIGAWTLANEMIDGATVPQVTGDRLCSQHFKGWPLDTVIGYITQGRPYRHVLGFEANERARANKDARYNTALRTGEYPLINWGWDRNRSQRFLRDVFDVDWPKSACSYCPFALATRVGRVSTVSRFIAEPQAGVLALVMEFTATAINPTQGLIKGERLLTLLRNSTGTDSVLGLFDELLATLPWAVYDVRRALSPRADGRFNHSRALRILDTGTRAAMHAQLEQRAERAGVPVTVGDSRFRDDQHPRVWLRRRDLRRHTGGLLPTGEQFLVVAPATAITKTGPAFPRAWLAASQLELPV